LKRQLKNKIILLFIRRPHPKSLSQERGTLKTRKDLSYHPPLSWERGTGGGEANKQKDFNYNVFIIFIP
jgi:hypothetical protein